MQTKNSMENAICRFDSYRDRQLASSIRKNADRSLFLGWPAHKPDRNDPAERILSSFVLNDLVQKIETFLDNMSSHEESLCSLLREAEELLSSFRLQK